MTQKPPTALEQARDIAAQQCERFGLVSCAPHDIRDGAADDGAFVQIALAALTSTHVERGAVLEEAKTRIEGLMPIAANYAGSYALNLAISTLNSMADDPHQVINAMKGGSDATAL